MYEIVSTTLGAMIDSSCGTPQYSVSYLAFTAVGAAGASMGLDLVDHLPALSRKQNHR